MRAACQRSGGPPRLAPIRQDARLIRATRIEQFASWLADLDIEAIPERVVERARLQAMNTVAAGLAGSTAPAVAKLREATSYWAAPGSVGVIGNGDEWEPAAAAYANAAASMAHDWDDYLYMGHTGHSAVWAARATGDVTGASADEILVAQIAANEIEGRLGAALFVGPRNGQFWSAIHCAGAAAAAAKLARSLGLHRAARRDREPPRLPLALLLRAAPRPSRRARQLVAHRHARLQGASRLRISRSR